MRCRQNWSESCENTLNEQIKTEYTASYKYHQIAAFFYRDDIGLNKLGDYFNKASLEEREHADKFLKYQTMRGGVAKLQTLPIEELDFSLNNVESVRQSLCLALQLEKKVNESLINLHKVAEEAGDAQFSDFIEGEFLNEQVEAISDISKKISQLEMIGDDGHGVWHFVQDL